MANRIHAALATVNNLPHLAVMTSKSSNKIGEYSSHAMDISSPYRLVIRATDKVASSQLQAAYPITVSTEGSDQLSSGVIPHLGQCTR